MNVAAIGLAVITVVGGVVALVVGEVLMKGAGDAVFRRPAFANMRSGWRCRQWHPLCCFR